MRRRSAVLVAWATVFLLVAAVQSAHASRRVKEFPVPTPVAQLEGITAGLDHTMWFTEAGGNKIGHITHRGAIAEYPLPTPGAEPWGIAAGLDGGLWFTEVNADSIGRLTFDDTIIEYPIPVPGFAHHPAAIAMGRASLDWFTVTSDCGQATDTYIGNISTYDETITVYAIPTPCADPEGIAAGPDGNMWFTELQAAKIGTITPEGVITEYPIPSGNSPLSIAAGPDGSMWFTEWLANDIGRITTDGVVTEYPIPSGSGPGDIAPACDGDMWFTDGSAHELGRITADGVITEFPLGGDEDPNAISGGPDGNVWFMEETANTIGAVRLHRRHLGCRPRHG